MIATSCGAGRYGNLVAVLGKLDFKTRGKTLLKPNLVEGGLAATHSDAVRAVLDTIDIDTIAEGSSVNTSHLFESLGYKKIAQDYGVELLDINSTDEWEEIEFLSMDNDVFNVRISKYAKRDVISLSLPKTHDHAIVTLTLKNMHGFVHPGDKIKLHGYRSGAFVSKIMPLLRIKPVREIARKAVRLKTVRKLLSATEIENERYIKGARVIHRNIAEVVKFVKLKLGIIDGFVGMEGEGPVFGKPVEWNMAIAGAPKECDVYCAHLMGFDPETIGYLHYLDAPPLNQIKILGDVIPPRKFTPHSKIEMQMMWKTKNK